MAEPGDLAAEIARVRQRHRQHVSVHHPEPGICVTRDGSWPCDVERLAVTAGGVLALLSERAAVLYRRAVVLADRDAAGALGLVLRDIDQARGIRHAACCEWDHGPGGCVGRE